MIWGWPGPGVIMPDGQIMRLLRGIVHDEGIAAIVATHDPVLIALADRVLNLNDGVLT